MNPDGEQAPGAGRALPPALHAANEGLAFLLELLMLAGLAWWGSQTVSGVAGRLTLAIAVPALAVIIWGLFAAPRARFQLPVVGVLAVKAIVFGGVTSAVFSIGHHTLAIAFAVVAAANATAAAIDRDALARRGG